MEQLRIKAVINSDYLITENASELNMTHRNTFITILKDTNINIFGPMRRYSAHTKKDTALYDCDLDKNGPRYMYTFV